MLASLPWMAGCGWIKGIVMPVVFTKPWAQGRVAAVTLGHSTSEFALPEFLELVRRAVLWAARTTS